MREFFIDGIIGDAVAPDVVAVFLQLADSFFVQPAARRHARIQCEVLNFLI